MITVWFARQLVIGLNPNKTPAFLIIAWIGPNLMAATDIRMFQSLLS